VKKTKRRSFFSKLRRFDNDVTSFVCKFWKKSAGSAELFFFNRPGFLNHAFGLSWATPHVS